MTGWHKGVMVALDTETDGPVSTEAHIITACVAVIDGSGARAPEVSTWVLKPTRPIPAEAAEIHGYSTERAEAEGQDPATAIKEITTRLGELTAGGAPIVAFNAAFDLTVLDRGMRRYGIGAVNPVGLNVVDPFVLDKALDRWRRGKRTLTACCEHYGVRLDGAHDASFDAVAATRVAWKIAQRNPQIASMTPDDLTVFQMSAKAEQDASLAEYFRKLARQAKELDDQIELNRKADGCQGHWPLIPLTDAQGAVL